jgi:hypothetical protein
LNPSNPVCLVGRIIHRRKLDVCVNESGTSRTTAVLPKPDKTGEHSSPIYAILCFYTVLPIEAVSTRHSSPGLEVRGTSAIVVADDLND